MLSVRVPASTSNLGAGFDCLGLALDIWLTASLVKGAGPPVYTGTLAGLFPAEDLILETLGGAPAGMHLEAHSDIPVGAGLGSSAAATVAGAGLVLLVARKRLDLDGVFRRAAKVEGHPDNAAPATYGGLVLAAHKPVKLTLHTTLGVALAVPRKGIDTKTARALLPHDVSRETAISQASRSAALVLGLEGGDPALIGFGMEDQLAVPHRRGMIPGFDAAVQAGIKAGAYGVTISGAGAALLAFGPKKKAAEIAKAMALALTAAGNPAEGLAPKVATKGLS
ncbi:MAG: homoserine kinase [Gemmatimonadetes bacterium]|nr:homoserine kinase [Gemmatimonadota bacterium]